MSSLEGDPILVTNGGRRVCLHLHQVNHFSNRDQRRFWPQRAGDASDLFTDALYRFLVFACRGARGKQDDAHINEALRDALQFHDFAD